MENLLYKIALTQIPNIGPILARNLLSYCGSPEAVFKSKVSTLEKIPGIGNILARTITTSAALQLAEHEISLLERHHVRGYFFTDPQYPERLRHLPDSPLMLYVRGDVDLNARRSIGIVGTRMPTAQGLALCEEFVRELTPYSPLIISGLAYGIDIGAHRSALASGLSTIGVLAHGLGYLYPAAHKAVASKMEQQGALVSEYLYNVSPDRENFPQRNRVVAGLCDAIVVVETGIQGGSMITAQLANDYNRDVFAFPGRVQDSISKGCNLLIKTNRAALIESASDLINAMSWEEQGQRHMIQKELFLDLSPEAKKIVDLMQKFEEISFDQLAFSSGTAPGALASLLLDLEFQGVVRSLPGKRYAFIPI